ncbi:hypothetical protein BJX68DRAFT_250335 [Aspergillus pseudodeflectus]|uniref:Aldehyde dehydrogenase domain-containing protein n=1 Tax=Aspergillus pseudodeflectus TaxID=176178 RepID=A0ABR4J9L1_9EURO
MATAIEASTMGINYISLSGGFVMPLGGYKASGIRREGIYHSLDNYLKTKTILMSADSL